MKEALKVENVSKSFSDLKVLSDVSFSASCGSIFSLLGENGAGKTTLIKIISGLYKKDGGRVTVYGLDLDTEESEIKKLIAVCPQETSVAENLTVKENLEFCADIFGVENKSELILWITEKLSLENYRDKIAKKLSGGTKRRLAIGMSLISKPKLLFLDEPTVGLDVRARRELWKLIFSLKKECTVILTTHYLEEAEALSDYVAVLDGGVIKAQGTVAEIKALSKTDNIEDAFITLTGGDL